MRTWLINIWDHLRESFWFVPSILAGAAIILAFAAPEIDAFFAPFISDHVSWLTTSNDTARTLLGSIASATLTIVGVVISVAMVTLSITASQFGSRLLRNFMYDAVTQMALGACAATSLYCLLVLRLLYTGSAEGAVPHLSVGIALVFAVISFALIVYYLHHVALSI